jgi:hypothetical protein
VTVVDELTRFALNLYEEMKKPGKPDDDWNNQAILDAAVNSMTFTEQ